MTREQIAEAVNAYAASRDDAVPVATTDNLGYFSERYVADALRWYREQTA